MQSSVRSSDSFFGGLTDFSFHTFLTRRVLGVLYGLGVAIIALVYLGWVIGAFRTNALLGLLVLLIVGPLVSLVLLVVLRIYLELTAVLFGIYENTLRMSPGPQPSTQPSGLVPAPPPAGPQFASPGGTSTT
jgi:Domain of unknown function (DUF4282)